MVLDVLTSIRSRTARVESQMSDVYQLSPAEEIGHSQSWLPSELIYRIADTIKPRSGEPKEKQECRIESLWSC